MSTSSFTCPLNSERLTVTREGRKNNIYRITMHKLPENKLSKEYIQELIAAFDWIQSQLGKGSEGAVITSSSAGLPKDGEGCAKYWCTGADHGTPGAVSHVVPSDLFPILDTLLAFPFPTVAEITGHAFGAGSVLALCHDYRVMNSDRGYISMPDVDYGVHFDGIGLIYHLKLNPRLRRKMLLECHRFGGKEAFDETLVDAIAKPSELGARALQLAEKWAPKAKMGVYGLMRSEIVYGPVSEALRTSKAKL